MKTVNRDENLYTAIYRRLNRIGYQACYLSGEYVTMQFIANYLNSLIDPEYFKEDKYELMMMKDSMIASFKVEYDLKKNYTVKVENITSHEDEEKGISCIRLSSSIAPSKNLTITSDGERKVIEARLAYGTIIEEFSANDDNSFSYAYYNQEDNGKKELKYMGILTSCNANIKNNEYFSYVPVAPIKQEYKKRGLGAFFKEFTGNGSIRKICKSSSSATIYDDINLVFNELKKERDNVFEIEKTLKKTF